MSQLCAHVASSAAVEVACPPAWSGRLVGRCAASTRGTHKNAVGVGECVARQDACIDSSVDCGGRKGEESSEGQGEAHRGLNDQRQRTTRWNRERRARPWKKCESGIWRNGTEGTRKIRERYDRPSSIAWNWQSVRLRWCVSTARFRRADKRAALCLFAHGCLHAMRFYPSASMVSGSSQPGAVARGRP